MFGWYENLTQEKGGKAEQHCAQHHKTAVGSMSLGRQPREICRVISAADMVLLFHCHGAGGVPVVQAFACDR